MATSIKQKIRLGTLLMIFLILASAFSSLYHLARANTASRDVLKSNYESLEFCQKMILAGDSFISGEADALDTLQIYLRKQQANITEPGEQKLTLELGLIVEKITSVSSPQLNELRAKCLEIMNLNMKAIRSKQARMEKDMENAFSIQVMIVSIILIISLSFAYNFPFIVTTPLKKITEAIEALGEKNYKHRIHMDSDDEFGQLANAYNEMAARLEYFESSNLNKILFEKSRAEAVINSLKDASIGIDGNGIILFANNQALSLLELSSKEVVGATVTQTKKKNDLFRFLIESTDRSPFKIVIEGKENYFTREVIDVPQQNSTNKVIVLKNITSFKELDVAKTNFIATVSHELKTPLASSDLSLKLLENEKVGSLQEEQKELIQSLKLDNQRMLRILSELLNMSQVESGKIQLDLKPIDISACIETSVQTLGSAVREKNLRVVIEPLMGLPFGFGDKDKFTWVLNNLLSNAVKFSPAGSSITISANSMGNDIILAVSDEGEGIDEHFHEKIFERYFQVPGRTEAEGSGIGLAVSKEFMEAMGGKIRVQSKPGNGSRFLLQLPSIISS